MRSAVTILLLIACLLNQAIHEALPSKCDIQGATAVAAQPPTTDVLSASDLARFTKIAEALLTAYVVPQITATAFGRAMDAWDGRGCSPRPTLQTLDVRLQV